MKNPVKRKLLSSLLFAILFAGIFFASCSHRDASASFMHMMEQADLCIKNGDVNEAIRILKKSEKKAYSAYARLGVFKRYKILGEEKACEKVLQTAFKQLPDNPEICAVYGNFLLDSDRVDQAFKVTEKLAGTKYGSIHSEAVLRNLLNSPKEDLESILYGRELSSAYYDIYVGSDDVRWLRNCAMIYLLSGEYGLASSLQDREPRDSEDALFWGYVQYDSGNYDIAVRNLELVKSDLLRGAASQLASDAYVMMDDADTAEQVRAEYIERAKKFVKINPVLSVNSSLWAYNHEEYRRSYELLLDALIDSPDFIPALITYGRLAWEDSLPRQISSLEQAVRETDLRTKRMREYDERPKFTISDAISRMDDAIEKTSASGQKPNGDLIVERLSLYLKNNEQLPLNSKTALIWSVLEKNEIGTNLYPSHLVQFAVQKLLSYGLFDDARTLFTNYISAKFFLESFEQESLTAKKVETDIFGGEKLVKVPLIPESIARLAFGDRAADCTDRMEIWEVEFAAYFALMDDNVTAATRLYEYVLFETGGVKTANASGDIVSVSSLAGPSTAANLGMIYSSRGFVKRALALYTLAAGKSRSKVIKSRLLYRVAKIQSEIGKIQDARTSVAYSLSLDPSNADARLLRSSLEGNTSRQKK